MHGVFAGLSEPCTATSTPAPKGRAAITDVQTRPRAPRRAGPFYPANNRTRTRPSFARRSAYLWPAGWGRKGPCGLAINGPS